MHFSLDPVHKVILLSKTGLKNLLSIQQKLYHTGSDEREKGNIRAPRSSFWNNKL